MMFLYTTLTILSRTYLLLDAFVGDVRSNLPPLESKNLPARHHHCH